MAGREVESGCVHRALVASAAVTSYCLLPCQATVFHADKLISGFNLL